MTDMNAVVATLDDYAEAYCSKDIDGLMNLFDAGDDISLIGTGEDELCAGRSEIRQVFERNFAEATATRFEWGWRHVTIVEDFAVVATSVTIHLNHRGESIEVPVRWTVALVCRPQGWRWLHRNASSPAQSQEEGAAYPTGSIDGSDQ